MDWDDAYANRAHIPGAAEIIAGWPAAAAAARARLRPEAVRYGPEPRQVLDLVRPEGARGLLAVVHGGYWMAFGKDDWTQLALGPVARGWAVAVVQYTLAPEARIGAMAREVVAAIGAARARVPGPLRLVGHSAGGQLVTRAACRDLGVMAERVVSVSGVHDLRPLLRTGMAATLGLDLAEAEAESPALRTPGAVRLLTWVGGDERPEFLRQSALLASAWTGSAAETEAVIAPGQHHFSVIEALADPHSPLTEAVCAG